MIAFPLQACAKKIEQAEARARAPPATSAGARARSWYSTKPWWFGYKCSSGDKCSKADFGRLD